MSKYDIVQDNQVEMIELSDEAMESVAGGGGDFDFDFENYQDKFADFFGVVAVESNVQINNDQG